ncbi:hypothetical protein FJU30_18000 [Affinibrenneria salicis]|uniref:Dienelactone hydrolase domain-containing protein n=1 Tax=Affinibrenneria salicis TaxID=2590031 RepID=A0A5J5FWG1_9GAMM|nr:dienelactone hydrolase family protein [Affinibrenneria salicis]KAA8997658.1 hypothetical protein FJU30_18000 [Affinibrenneria salicis]
MQKDKFTFSPGDRDALGYHFNRSGTIRILMLPDWQGCETSSAHRLASNYATQCDAEVILTDIYDIQHRPWSYEQADRMIKHSLDNPQETRKVLKNYYCELERYWQSSGPLFVVGFCFGGSLSFEFGRAELPCLGVVSVHGQPDTKKPILRVAKKPAFLMLHGAEDPFILNPAINRFMDEMRIANADWSLYYLGGARHSFTRDDIPSGNPYMGYSDKADTEAMLALKIMAERLLS